LPRFPIDIYSTMQIGMALAMMPPLTGAFAGVTESGWKFRRADLTSMVRVENLGGRRVRIEVKGSQLEDSFTPVLTTGPPSDNGDKHD